MTAWQLLGWVALATSASVMACAAPTTDDASGAEAAVTAAYRLPGEFAPVETVIVTWSDNVDAGWSAFTNDVVRAASQQARVLVVVAGDGAAPVHAQALVAKAAEELRSAGARMDHVSLRVSAIDTIWVRDWGPEVVRAASGQRRAVHADCCSDDERPKDALAAIEVARSSLALGVVESTLAMQGGNLQSDGEGRCITTSTLVEDNGGAQGPVGAELRRKYGCDHLIVLPPLDGEPNGHVDMLATITAPGEVIVGQTFDDPTNAARLDAASSRLAENGFRVRRIPMPSRVAMADAALGGHVFPSYTNALAVNGAVLVPVFAQDRTKEAAALEVFRSAYPGRTVIPIESGALIRFGGAVHCATMSVAR